MSSKKVLEINYIGSLFGHNGWVTALQVGKDSDSKPLLVSGSRDRKVIVWKLNLDTPEEILDSEGKSTEERRVGKPFRSMQGHSHFISSLALSRDSKHVVSASCDKTLRLWDLNTFRTMQLFKGHEKDVLSVGFSEDNRIIYSGSMDRTLKYWNTAGKCQLTVTDFGGWVSCMTTIRSNKQSLLAVGSGDNQVRIYDKDAKYTNGISQGFDYGVVSIASDEDGEFLFCGEKNGMIRVNSVQDDGKSELKNSIDVNADINAISFENKYYMAITSATSKGLFVNEVSKNHKLYSYEQGGACLSLAWDETRKYLFAGFADGAIRVYEFFSNSD